MNVHDRLPLHQIVAPGPKTLQQHKAIRLEVERMDDRLDELAVAAQSPKPFARMLATEHAERVKVRLNVIVNAWSRYRGSR